MEKELCFVGFVIFPRLREEAQTRLKEVSQVLEIPLRAWIRNQEVLFLFALPREEVLIYQLVSRVQEEGVPYAGVVSGSLEDWERAIPV